MKNRIKLLLFIFVCLFTFGNCVYAEGVVRYTQDNASADNNKLYCNSEVLIEDRDKDCYKNSDGVEVCKYKELNGIKKSGLVYRNKLNESNKDLVCSGEKVSKIINDTRYMQIDTNDLKDEAVAAGLHCSEAVSVTYCYVNTNGEEICKIKTSYGSSWTVKSKYLAKSQEAAKKFCGDTSTVLFDQNYGYGLECNRKSTYYSDGICYSKVKNGTSQAFPVNSADNKMVRDGTNYLMGWTKDVINGTPVCASDYINGDVDTGAITSDTVYYACYTEDIGGYRYLQEGAEIDKPDGVDTLKCGDEFWIDYCTRNQNGGQICYGTRQGVLRKIDRSKIALKPEGASCGMNLENKYYYAVTSNSDFSCGEAVYVTSCDDNTCVYNKVSKFDGSEISVDSKTVSKDSLVKTTDEAKKACNKENSGKACKESDNKKVSNQKGTNSYSFCYKKGTSLNKIKNNIQKKYTCSNGYTFENAIANENEVDGDNCIDGMCYISFDVSCKGGSNIKPVVSVISGIVQSDGYGIITVKARSVEGKIVKYYESDEYLAPTNTSSGWKNVSGDTFNIKTTPGTKFIWVKDSKGNISNANSGSVIDTVNTDTTVQKLELYDKDGKVQTPSKVSVNDGYVKSNKYVMLSNKLEDDSKVLADAFNPFDTQYKLDVSSPTISVYATLTSTDSNYVAGYEPRTVNLKYGMNTILIKIQNKEGKIRTYTILVNRKDDRTSDNTLNDITLSDGKINFNSNVTDYKIEIKKDTLSVDVNATIASNLASFVEGYEPGSVETILDTSVKLIKVKSQTGSTRTYVLTFVKEGTDVIDDESLQLNDLVIPDVYVPFESNVSNYSFSVDYETDTIDLKYNLKDDSSRVIITYKKKSDSEYKVVNNVGLPLDVGENFVEIKVINSDRVTSYYRFTIIRKEFGLDISSDTNLKELKVLGYDIKFNPSKKEYTVRIKQEKSLVITAVPKSNRAEVFIRGNDELTGFSTVRVKVVAENGKFETYSIDIKKDAFNKSIEIASIIAGCVIIIVSSCIIIIKKKTRANKEYLEE